MPFVSPMLASPMPEHFDFSSGPWIAEEKFDGHRMCVSVAETGGDLFGKNTSRAWSRDGIPRILPQHIMSALDDMPSGVFDGELLVPGKRSYGTATIANAKDLILIIFDVVDLLGRDLTTRGMGALQHERRAFLEEVFAKRSGLAPAVQLAWTKEIQTQEDIESISEEVWARDGEGLILKRIRSPYVIGKRSKDWVKVKQLHSAILTVRGYQPGKMGPQSTLVLQDAEGYYTTVKWKSLVELEKLNADPQAAIGRRLRIEYQERTSDGAYRHPRWDSWVENEL